MVKVANVGRTLLSGKSVGLTKCWGTAQSQADTLLASKIPEALSCRGRLVGLPGGPNCKRPGMPEALPQMQAVAGQECPAHTRCKQLPDTSVRPHTQDKSPEFLPGSLRPVPSPRYIAKLFYRVTG